MRILQKCLWPRSRPRDAQRVCIYRIGNIGDIVCALPAIHAIRRAYPDAHLTLLTSPGRKGAIGAADLLEGAPWLDELDIYYAEDIKGFRQIVRFLRRLRERAFDVWIELPPDLAPIRRMLRDIFVARATGARWACGWQMGTVRVATQAQSELLTFPNEVDRLLAIVAECGIPVGETVFPLPINEHHRRYVDEILRKDGLTGKPLVVIAPGAKRSTNRWPLDRFSEVGRHLVGEGFKVLVMGGATDSESCASIVSAIGPGAFSVAGKLSLLESCEMLRRCDLLICNDSGVQHLAAAVGAQCLSLFSFWQPQRKWWPYGPQHTVLQKWVECHTCYLNLCPYDNRCIKLIETDEVIAWADKKLDIRSSSVTERLRVASPGYNQLVK